MNDKKADVSNSRRFPRRLFFVPMGYLEKGNYSMGKILEIGEGGMRLSTPQNLEVGKVIVLNFFIPSKSFIVATGTVVYKRDGKAKDDVSYGLKFTNITFDRRRQIRDMIATTKITDVV